MTTYSAIFDATFAVTGAAIHWRSVYNAALAGTGNEKEKVAALSNDIRRALCARRAIAIGAIANDTPPAMKEAAVAWVDAMLGKAQKLRSDDETNVYNWAKNELAKLLRSAGVDSARPRDDSARAPRAPKTEEAKIVAAPATPPASDMKAIRSYVSDMAMRARHYASGNAKQFQGELGSELMALLNDFAAGVAKACKAEDDRVEAREVAERQTAIAAAKADIAQKVKKARAA